MQFKKEILNKTPQYFDKHNRYHIINYSGWRAYFKPWSWKSFGNACEVEMNGNSVIYKTIKMAKEACLRHQTKFGEKPGQWDTILVA